MKKFILILVILIFSCEKKESLPSSYHSFVQLTFELNELRNEISVDSVYIDTAKVLLSRFGYNKEQYDRTMAYLKKNPQKWEAFFTAFNDFKQKHQK